MRAFHCRYHKSAMRRRAEKTRLPLIDSVLFAQAAGLILGIDPVLTRCLMPATIDHCVSSDG